MSSVLRIENLRLNRGTREVLRGTRSPWTAASSSR